MSAAPAAGFGPAMQDALFRKLLWRLVPFLFCSYVVSSLDRVNVGVASLTMAKDIGLGSAALGLGFGIFSAGYVCCEIPSNLAMHRFGARIWIARIMITWGLVSMGTFLVTNAYNFYAARFILGVAEAGFVPGIVYYLTLWFPAVWRAKAMVAFLVAIPISVVIGSPISGALLGMEGIWGLHGWQWLFIIEGSPAIILGVMCLFVLTDRPGQAAWLTGAERDWLQGVLARESEAMERRQSFTVAQVLTNGRVITLCAINFCYIVGNQGIGIWIPQLVKGFGLTNLQVGFVTAIPFLCGSIGMILWGRHSDRMQERTWHVAGAGLVAAAGLAASAAFASASLSLVALTIGVTGIFCFFGTFWAIPPSFLTGRAAAAGIAMIISVGNCGGLVGPFIVGWTRELTGSFTLGFVAMSGFFVVASLLIVALHFVARIHEVSLPVDQAAID
ncbi:MFS transporter [Acidisphaera sp. S103]|uniref:MFS transporter n=1 Tax=Acidisphaera sp. S103 TaxID=1747223 RepID=UPI00131DFB70|nr:MFS transporter [Acidisphaera sp. S103]